MRKVIVLFISHGLVLFVGFAAGIYTLPILIAPDAPASETLSAVADKAEYSAKFQRDLEDSDAFHWGEGDVFLSDNAISHRGELAPGPDYKLYLSPTFVETESDFNRLKSSMTLVGDIKTFKGFLVSVPENIKVSDYNSVIVWCETFGEFITAAKYQ